MLCMLGVLCVLCMLGVLCVPGVLPMRCAAFAWRAVHAVLAHAALSASFVASLHSCHPNPARLYTIYPPRSTCLQVKSAFTRAFNQQHVKPRTGFGMDDKVRCNSILSILCAPFCPCLLST